jgi:hypothetical protein
MDIDALGPYLSDHLAGSSAGLDLAQRLQAEADGTDLGEMLAGLVADIQADRAALEDLAKELGVEPGGLKQAAGKVVERLSRVRTDRRIVGNEAMSRMMELESLSLGIEGKRAMWLALEDLAGRDGGLEDLDFHGLAKRAKDQRKRLEPYRLAAAREAVFG